MDKKSILMEQIDKLLAGKLTYKQFEAGFWSYYLEESAHNNFSVEVDDFFAEIQETFDWTSENITDEERGYGYLDWPQFIEFVRKAKGIFLEKGKLDFEEAEKIRDSVKI